jgi:hypothetical protein
MTIDPRHAYQTRRAQWSQCVDAGMARDQQLVWLRGALFIAGCLAIGLSAYGRLSWWWCLALWVSFGLAAWVHEQVIVARQRAERAVTWYLAGLARLDGQWVGQGDRGDDLLPSDHPYARDLDLIGAGSLFERISTARTALGRQVLATWLGSPAEVPEVLQRQEAIRELTPLLELREELALAAEAAPRRIVLPSEPGPDPSWLFAIGCAVLVNLAVPIAILMRWLPPVTVLGTVLFGAGIALLMRPRVQAALHYGAALKQQLRQLLGVLQHIERQPFQSKLLVQLKARLGRELGASQASAQLAATLDRWDWRLNQVFLPLSMILMWTSIHAVMIERWRRRHGAEVENWLLVAAEFEALTALASFAFEEPTAHYPELVAAPARFEATGLSHPLLHDAECVRNDVSLGREVRIMIVSGSNMSGKSTLLRSIGLNLALALAGAPVRAERLVLSGLKMAASLRIQDSLLEHRSLFLSELGRLRQLIDLARSSEPTLFLIDEIFHGTNSHDRRIGAGAMLEELCSLGAIGLVTTHDLAITQVVESLGPVVVNNHFVDHLENGEMRFDYRLHSGVVTKSNALELMRATGLLRGAEPTGG